MPGTALLLWTVPEDPVNGSAAVHTCSVVSDSLRPHGLHGHESAQTPGDSEGPGGLAKHWTGLSDWTITKVGRRGYWTLKYGESRGLFTPSQCLCWELCTFCLFNTSYSLATMSVCMFVDSILRGRGQELWFLSQGQPWNMHWAEMPPSKGPVRCSAAGG